VDIDSPAIERRPARDLDSDSDLGARLVTVSVGPLASAEIDAALAKGLQRAQDYQRRGLIADAALMLADITCTLGAIPTCHSGLGTAQSRDPANLTATLGPGCSLTRIPG
jgi:hypothetical protein